MDWNSLLKNAYTPYSNNAAACVVESKNGICFAGVRVENISFPLTIPAVQAACCICLSEGEIPARIHVQNTSLPQLEFWVKEFDMDVITHADISRLSVTPLHKHPTPENVLGELKQLLSHAVTPCSDFPVSALLFVEDGYYEGVNVEVSDWTKGLCGERVALAKAIAEGYTQFKQIEIHTLKGEISSPCGACRQVILEHMPYNEIKLYHADGSLTEHLSVDLLPFSFKSATLKR